MFVTPNRPSVRVPVLSKMMAWIFRALSNAARSLMRRPFLAEIAVETATTRGAASPRACGQAVIMTVTIRSRANANGLPAKASQAKRVSAPTLMAMRVSQRAARFARSWVRERLSCACRTSSMTWER